MLDRNDIREHMDVIGSDGRQLGTVDRVEANEIKLARSDSRAGGEHHWIPLDWVEAVDESVRLSKTADDAQKEWRTESVGAGAGTK